MKYKAGNRFLTELEIMAVDADHSGGCTPYFIRGLGTGWYSKAALDGIKSMDCKDCKWSNARHQKYSCCIRNTDMKDNYEWG